jgi:hypothetical protein
MTQPLDPFGVSGCVASVASVAQVATGYGASVALFGIKHLGGESLTVQRVDFNSIAIPFDPMSQFGGGFNRLMQ